MRLKPLAAFCLTTAMTSQTGRLPAPFSILNAVGQISGELDSGPGCGLNSLGFLLYIPAGRNRLWP